MRLNKRLALLLMPLALFLCMLMSTNALAQTGSYVFDESDVLDSATFTELEQKGAAYADTYGVGTYILFTDSMGASGKVGASERREFARDYYLEHDLGVGDHKNGIIFVVATESRQYVTVKHFEVKSEDPFSDTFVDALEDAEKSYLKHNEWTEAAEHYYLVVGNALKYFGENGTQQGANKGSFVGLLLKFGATIGVPLVVALGVVSSEKRAMLTARMQTEAANYLDPGSFSLTSTSDTFVNRTVTSTPIPKHDDSDSGGGWSDMGGGFSGSSGGDF